MPTELIWKSQRYSVNYHLKGYIEARSLKITLTGLTGRTNLSYLKNILGKGNEG